MGKAEEEALAQLLKDTFVPLSAWNGKRVKLAASEHGFAAGTLGTLHDVSYFKDNGEVVGIFSPDGAPESQGWCLSAAALQAEDGSELTHYYKEGAASMTEQQLAGPMYADPNIDQVTHTFQAFAPSHPVSEQFFLWYTGNYGTDASVLHQYMHALNIFERKWTPRDAAQCFISLLSLHGEEPSELVSLMAATDFSRPAAAAAAPVAEETVTIAPVSVAPVALPANLPAGPVPFAAVAAPVTAPAPSAPVSAPVAVAAPVVATVPAAVAEVPAAEPVGTTPWPEVKERRGRPKKKDAEVSEAPDTALGGRVNLRLAAALAPFLAESPATFEADVAAVLKALLLLRDV